jgi:hypothetical protein
VFGDLHLILVLSSYQTKGYEKLPKNCSTVRINEITVILSAAKDLWPGSA